MIILHTNHGDITLELDAENAPATVANFLQYVRDGHYDNTIFHRVIDGFMIQGGGFTPDMTQKKTNPSIKLEAQNGLTNKRGTVAMARTQAPDSVGSQFFIVLDDRAGEILASANTYQIIGSVSSGMNAVDAIYATSAGVELPTDPVVVTTATVTNP